MKKKTDDMDNLFSNAIESGAEIVPMAVTDNDDLLLKAHEGIPSDLPILPIRGNVFFPGVLMPITVGRKKSLRLIKNAERHKQLIGVVTQRDDKEVATRENLFDVGCVARVLKVIELPDGNLLGIIQSHDRFELGNIISDDPFMLGEVKRLLPEDDSNFRPGAVRSSIATLRKKYTLVLKNNQLPDATVTAMKNLHSNKLLVNFVAAHNSSDVTAKQTLLEMNTYTERLEGTIVLLDSILEQAKLRDSIKNKARQMMDRQQHEYFLNQQMQVIQEELGGSPTDKEIEEMIERSKHKKWSKEVQDVFDKSISKLRRTPPTMPDFTVELNHLNLLLDMPWNEFTKDNLDTKNARRILDRDHYGLEKVKERIIEQIAVLKIKGDMKAPILCLVGPPGTGKTSLGKSIAEALNRKYVRMALGGLHDEAELRGHRKTYVGAMPGRIIQNLNKVKSANPVFILDEIDKVQTNSFNGDPTAALLEILDPEQNSAFHDNYLDLDFDLSKVLFIATANSLSTIQPALLDRMEIIDLSGYILEEKLEIASRHLVPRGLSEVGFSKNAFKFPTPVLTAIINDYTRESGVRQLDKTIAKILRKKAVKVAEGEKTSRTIKISELQELLGLPIHQSEKRGKSAQIGIVTGLAWTQVGGEILFIEACTSKGKGTLSMTGNLGNVMQESASLAFEYIKANAVTLGIDEDKLQETNIHIHAPEGATPKDGPSAGITMFVAMISVLTKRKVKSQVAMTGEITLRGAVTPVGGIKEKILAAKRAEITDIILSEDNRRDIEDINQEYLTGLTFHYITEMQQALPLVLEEE